MNLVLFLLSKVYFLLTYVRNKLYDLEILKSYKSKLKVICVGNLTVGGNGKTPLSAYLFKELSKSNNPIILTRGYKSKIKKPYLVKSDDNAGLVGDEPLMLTKFFNAIVVVSPSRIEGAKFIEKEGLGDLIILDDGFQHRRLKTDCNIVAVNYDSNTYNQYKDPKLLPLGRFRESFSFAKMRVDAFVLINRSTVKQSFDNKDIQELFGKEKVFFADLKQDKVLVLNSLINNGEEGDIDLEASFVVVTALANPDGFVKSVKDLVDVEKVFTYPDHYSFKKEDFDKVNQEYPNSKIFCTLKDVVKINPDWGFPIYVFTTCLKFEEHKGFINRLKLLL